ncbi:MAG: Ig-like domain-containing protein, partial [Acidobacteriaceae bacterium]
MSRSLTGLVITPAANTASVSVGQTAQFQAIAIYTESGHQTTQENVTSSVTWASAETGVATITSAGLATGMSPGVSSITANIQGSFGPLSASSNILVATQSGGGQSRALTSVSVIPGGQNLTSVGEVAQFIAIGNYSSAPSSANLTSLVTWQSSDTTVAQVSSTGAVTGQGVGTATITALATGPDGSVVTGSGTVTVNNPISSRTLVALNVSPGSQVLTAAGQQAQFIAIGTYTSAPLSADLTDSVTWQSSDSSIATVASDGVVTAVGTGSATITALGTASDGSVVTGAGSVTVQAGTSGTRILTSLTVIPSSQTLTAAGQTASFIAIGTYSAAPLTADLTSSVTWETSTTNVATVNASGVATAVAAGTASITALGTATDGSVVSASGTLNVNTSTTGVRLLTGLNVSPGNQVLTGVGATAQFSDYGTFNTSPTSLNLTTSSTWSSSDTGVATVNSSTGVVTSVGAGSTTITAQATGPDGSQLTATGTVTVVTATTPPTRILTSLSIIPASQTVNSAGESTQFLAIGTYNVAPLTADLTDQVTWVSSDTTVASVTPTGVATALSLGETTISATATAADGSPILATASIQNTGGGGTILLPILDVYLVGTGTGTVTSGTQIN